MNTAEFFGASSLIIRNRTIADARNKGLIAARACNWKTILFLDDDIGFCNLEKVRYAAKLLDDVTAVSFAVRDFPDNSVVRHAARIAGIPTPVWPSGSALLISMAKLPASRLFPGIYNEDWFFLYDLPVVMTDGIVCQKQYNPFVIKRAAREEFGDLIAEALNDDTTGAAFAGDRIFWEKAIRARKDLIAEILGRSSQDNIIASLRESQKVLKNITAAQIQNFLESWQHHYL